MRPLALALLVTAFLPPLARAQVQATFATFGQGCAGTGTGLDAGITVSPANMATRFGSPNALPFGWSPVRYQQVHAGADFPAALTMAGLSLRQSSRGPISNRFILDLEIQVGYTTRTPGTMSPVFANNFDSGSPVVVLPRVQLAFPDMVPSGPTSPADFFFTIPWPVTFDWTPSPGRNFLMQVTVFGNSYGGVASGYGLDAASGPTIGRIYGSPATATSGTLEPGLGLVLGIRARTHTAVPALYSTNTPQIGDSFRVRFSQARPSSTALILFGVSNSVWVGGLPMDLGFLGAPSCTLLTSIDDVQTMAIDAAGAANHVYQIPNSIYLLGRRFYNQGMIVDPPANGLGFAFSNGGVAVIGNQ
jgi:hypothetical protein